MAELNGIICINKPQEFTSFDVVAKMRGITGTKKIGHAGTLDPMATGVLPLFFGCATRACDRMPEDGKRYTADFQLGLETDTYDIWGKILREQQASCSRSEIEAVLAGFRGRIEQLPPMFSAVRVNGQRLYELARQGKTIERKPRCVEITLLELLEFDEERQCGRLDIVCSKGTYIRSICHDLGERLGCGDVMTGLVRTQAGIFTLKDCITLEQAQKCAVSGDFSGALLPVERLFRSLPAIRLNEVQSKKFCNGLRLDINRVRHQRLPGSHAVYDNSGGFLGLAVLDFDKMELVIEKIFAERK